MCTVLLPPGVNPITVKYMRPYHISYLSYRIVSYRVMSCHIVSYHIIYVGVCSQQGGGSKSRALRSLIECNTFVKPADRWLLSFVLLYRLANLVLTGCKRSLKLNVGLMTCSTSERGCENKRLQHIPRRNDILRYI